MPADSIALPAPSATYLIKPLLESAEASAISEPIQNIVFHAPFSFITSSHVSTSVRIMTTTASMPTVVAPMW